VTGSSAPSLSSGTVLGQRYRLERFLARGGMGEVYEAVDERSPGERVAIKVLHLEFARDAEWCGRFRREAEVATAIVSPYVARLWRAGKNREGRRWMAFELLVGESLDACLKREGRLPFAEVAWMLEHALRGLHAAHSAGVIHRDIKPGNLFVERDPRTLRVLDFGIAKRIRIGTASSGLTGAETTLGTPSYMSPEQLVNPGAIDARADLYSVGLVAYRALAGRLPFDARNLGAIVEAKHAGDLPSLTRVSGVTWPDAVEGWLRTATATRAEDRFATAEAARSAWSRARDAMNDYRSTAVPEGSGHEDTEPAATADVEGVTM
jgi:serine/threonine protein kinase